MHKWWGLAAAGIWLSACSLVRPAFERPVVSVVNVQLLGGNFRQQNFLVTLDVDNPNDRELPVTSLNVDLAVLGERVASGASGNAFVVPARGHTRFDMTVTANMALALLKLAGRDKHSDTGVPYDVTGTANLDLAFLRNLPFHQSGSFVLK